MADQDPAPADAAAPPAAQPTSPAAPPTADKAEPQTDKAESQTDEEAEPQTSDIAAEKAAIRTDNYLTTITQLTSETVVIGGEPIRRARRTFFIGDDEIRRTLRFFHDPPAFGEALSQLVEDNLVVLCGAEGSGRWCAALHLLDGPHCPGADRERSIERLAPETQLATLPDHSFVPGGRYLLADLISDVEDAQLRFDTAALLERLKVEGAFLVITSRAAPSAFGPPAVAWTAPEVVAVFDTYAGTADWLPEHTAAAREVVATLPLHRFPEFVDVLEGDGLEVARTRFGGRVTPELRMWLDKEPGVPDLVPLLTAALIPDAVEEEHERRASRLLTAIDDYAERKRSDADYVDALRPSRSARRPFVSRERAPQPGAKRVGLAANLPAHAVLAELHERYGDELWAPIHAWLDTQPDADLHIAQSLAHGMTALRLVDVDLTEQVLDGWATGDDSHRWAAAAANSVLCVDDRGVRIALAQAIRWAHGTQQQRITAVYAFSLGLSISEPRQAINRLWHLTLSDIVVARYARAHLVALARDTAGIGTRRRVLKVVKHQLGYLIAALHDDDPRIGRALTSVEQILAVRTANDTPLTVQVLDADPGQAERLGPLWAHVLRSWQHRATALDELHVAYTRLTEPSAAALGAAIHGRLSPMEWRWLCRDLGIELRTGTGTETEALEAAR